MLLALAEVTLSQFAFKTDDEGEEFTKNRHGRLLEWMTESWQKAVDLENRLMRLSNDLIPKNYNVQLLPILENDNFTNYGKVDITVECVKDTYQILLNAANYRIHSYEALRFFLLFGST